MSILTPDENKEKEPVKTEYTLPDSKFGDGYINKVRAMTSTKDQAHHVEQVKLIIEGMKKFEDEYEEEIKKIETAAKNGNKQATLTVPNDMVLNAKNWLSQQRFKVVGEKKKQGNTEITVKW